MMIPRRTFLASLGATAAAVALGRRADALPSGAAAALVGSERVGLERIGLGLYAVRGAMKADPERTLAAIRAIGYTDVELLWTADHFGRTPKEVRATLDQEGLKAPSAHIAPELLVNSWEQQLSTAKQLGHQFLVVPSLPPETKRSLDAWKLWASRFNVAGEVARRAGIWLAFHNEPSHQRPLFGEVPLEVFVRALDPKVVRLQLDVGNMLLGGGDPLAFLARHRARCATFHLKNVTADHAHDTELGAGVFDLRAFLAAIPDLRKKPCFVEQENATDELASAKANYEYLRTLTF